MNIKSDITGYLNGKTVPQLSRGRGYDGKKVDEFLIFGILKSRLDVDKLIDFLEVHKYCFDKPQ